MNNANTRIFHFLKTRADQRKVTKALKAKGLHATNTSVKTAEGWQIKVKPVKRPVKLADSLTHALNGNGSHVQVFTK